MSNAISLPGTRSSPVVCTPAAREVGMVQGYCRMCHGTYLSEGVFVGACLKCRQNLVPELRANCPAGCGAQAVTPKSMHRLHFACGHVYVHMSGLGFADERFTCE